MKTKLFFFAALCMATLTVQAQKFTAGAKEKIEAVGGKAEVI